MKKIVMPAIGLVVFAGAAAASPMPVRATIDAVNGNTLSVTETSGAKTTVTLAPGAKIAEVIPYSLSEVKAGSYIGTAAVAQPGGEYRALELQVFPESMRGVGLGTRAWNLEPHSSMTNGTVGSMAHESGTVGAVSGNGDMTLTVNDGSGKTKTVLIPQGVPVVSYAPGSTADLTPGAHIIFFAAPGAAGPVSVARLSVGKNGLTPPM